MDPELFCKEALNTTSFHSLSISTASGSHHEFLFFIHGPIILWGEFPLREQDLWSQTLLGVSSRRQGARASEQNCIPSRSRPVARS